MIQKNFIIFADNLSDPVACLDSDLRYIYCNKALEREMGVCAADLNGKTVLDFVKQNSQNEILFNTLRKSLSLGEVNELEQVLTTPVGIKTFSTKIIPEKNGDGKVEFLAVISKEKNNKFNPDSLLSEKEKGLLLLFERIEDMISMHSPDSSILFTNNACLSLLDYKPEELIGLRLMSFIHHDDLDNTKMIIDSNISMGNDKYHLSHRLKKKNGDFVWVETVGLLNYNNENQLKDIWCVTRNIKERKKLEYDLFESERKFSRIFLESSNPIMIIDVENGCFVEVNKAVTRNLEYSREELIGRNATEIGIVNIESGIQIQELLVQNGCYSDLEVKIKTKTGKDRIGIGSGEIICVDNHYYILQTIADITERKHAEDALYHREKQLRQIIDLVPHFIFAKDLEGKFILVNKAVADAYGTTVKNLLGKTDADFSKSESEVQHFKEHDLSVINSGTPLQIPEEEITDAKGIVRKLATVKIPFTHSDNDQPAILGVSVDITEQRKAENELRETNKRLEEALFKLKETQKQVSQQERMRALGQLASGICHDINNSLTPIMGYVDLLTDDEEVMKRNENSIKMILKSTKNIARTVGRLREFYKVKLTTTDLVEIDLNKVVTSTLELTKHRWKNMAESTGSTIDIKLNLQDRLPLTMIDESEIIEALTNLVLNACDAMPNGGILTLKTYKEDENIIIQIIDSGCGMDKDTLKHCMDPFFTTKGDKGTGLGLAMVYGVMERHKGLVEMISEVNKGTTISLVIPILNEIIMETDDKIEMNPEKILHILLVEDDLSINDMLKNILENKGHKVIQATDGQLGLELFKKFLHEGQAFDIVITDLGMPGMDGYSLSKSLKILTPSIPIILLTGWGALINKDSYPEINYILKKPIMREDLFKEINQIINDRQ